MRGHGGVDAGLKHFDQLVRLPGEIVDAPQFTIHLRFIRSQRDDLAKQVFAEAPLGAPHSGIPQSKPNPDGRGVFLEPLLPPLFDLRKPRGLFSLETQFYDQPRQTGIERGVLSNLLPAPDGLVVEVRPQHASQRPLPIKVGLRVGGFEGA